MYLRPFDDIGVIGPAMSVWIIEHPNDDVDLSDKYEFTVDVCRALKFGTDTLFSFFFSVFFTNRVSVV